jgi:hypothetical protein
MKRFPAILHVTMDTQDKETFLLPSENGVFGIAVAGESKPCAIYKLIEVGTVVASPKFVGKRKLRNPEAK